MRLKVIYLLSFILLLGGQASAQEVMPLSLKQATDYALKHNYTLKNARLDVAIQKAKNAEITGLAFPQIGIKNDFNAYPNQVQSFVPAEFVGGPAGTFVAVPFTPKFSNTTSASANQLIFDGTVLVVLQAKRTLMKLAELGARATEQQVRYNIQQSYYTIVVSKRQVALINNSIASFRSIARDMDVMYKEGVTEKVESDRMQVQLNNLVSDSIAVANMIETSEQMLKYMIGMPIARPILLTDTAVEQEIANAQASLLEDVNYENRVEYSLGQTQIRYNQFDLKRYQYSRLPSLSAFASGTYTYASNRFTDVATPSNYIFYSVVGFSLNIPIFKGFAINNQVKQARYKLEQSQNNLENAKLAIDLETQKARTDLRNALLKKENEERNLELANSVLDIAKKKYKAGVGSSIEVNTAQTDLLRSQGNYFQTLTDVMNAQTDLQKALGYFNKN